MGDVLVRAACFVAVILLGYVLRRVGVFHEDAFHVLSRIVLKITLPAAIVVSFSGKEIAPSMLFICLLGFGFGALYIGLGFLMSRKRPPEKRAFDMLNLAGYNIGNFTLPFVQSFLGPAGVITTSLFDTGNSFICLGGAFGFARMVQRGERFSFVQIGKALLRSVPFLTYITMTVLALLHLALPQPVIEFAQIAAGANAFLAMLMIGIGFQVNCSRAHIFHIARILSVRYGVALLGALACYFALPLALEYRQALALLVFSPIASAAPPFTAELENDFGLSSAVNSVSILVSIVCITVLLTIML